MRGYWQRYRKRIYSKLRASLIRFGYHSKPAFLIIGAQKCGTSALFTYLSKHPHIIPASMKEIHFFNRDLVYSRGTVWYHSHFPLPHRLAQGAITFEASPTYLYHSASAGRIFSYNPQIKLIVILRDPVDRAYSAWNMQRTLSYENPQYLFAVSREADEAHQNWIDRILDSFPEFDQAVHEEIDLILSGDSKLEPSYVRRGLYYEQLLRYCNYFDRGQILIIDFRLLRGNIALVLSRINQFVGLPECDWNQIDLPLINVGKYERQMPAKVHAFLREFYKPHNEKLYQLFGHDFGWQ